MAVLNGPQPAWPNARWLREVGLVEALRSSARMGVNYGSDKVRFPAPVRVGARIRGSAQLVAARKFENAAVQLIVRMTVEIEDEVRPGCVADIVARFYF